MKLRIFIYGKNALDDILSINKNFEIKVSQDTKYKIKPYIGIDSKFNWDYFIFKSEFNEEVNDTIKNYLIDDYKADNMLKTSDEIRDIISKYSNYEYIDEINKEISKVLSKYRQFYDVLVICVDNLLDKQTQSVFKYFQGFTYNNLQQPFILFLTKNDNNPKISDLYQFINNEYFDKRNVYSTKFPKNEEEINKINNFFIKCMNYYHEICNNDINPKLNNFNILVCGTAGTGKSTFINQFFHEKVAREGYGLSVTNKISYYIHSEYPITIIDTPGFEDDLTVKMTKGYIKKLEKDMIATYNHIDIILYFKQLEFRPWLSIEVEFIKWLFKKNKKIIFVLNDFNNNRTTQIARIKTFEDGLKLILSTINIDKQDCQRIEEFIKNVVVIKLIQNYDYYEDEDEDTKIIIKQCYGMDSLIHKIYELFQYNKISICEIENSKDIIELLNKIKNYKSLENITKFINFHLNKKLEASKLILSYSYQDYFVWLMKDKRRNELIEKINELYKGNKIYNIDEFRESLKIKVDKIIDKNKIIEEYLESIRPFKHIFEKDNYNLDSHNYNDTTFLIGCLILNKYLNKYNKNNDSLKNSLKEFCLSFNNALDGFNKLSKDWKYVYDSLKKHKSDLDWVNKFFVVEFPKKE